jgi:hypothetical protein
MAVDARSRLEAAGADDFSVAMLRGLAATWAVSASEFALARSEAEEAWRLGTSLRNPSVLTTASFSLGWALADDDPDRALDHFEETIALIRAGAGDGVFTPALTQAGVLRARRGDLAEAVDLFTEGVEYALRGGLAVTMIGCLNWGIETLGRLGRHDATAIAYGVVRVGPLEAAVGEYWSSPGWLETVDAAKQALGASAFDELTARGAAMSYDEVTAWLRDVVADLRSGLGTSDG